MTDIDYYQTLQVDPQAEPEVIAAAYRRLVQKYHPDHNRSSAATARMQQLNRAYRVLRDPRLRALYDQERLARGAVPGSPADTAPVDQPSAAYVLIQPISSRPSYNGGRSGRWWRRARVMSIVLLLAVLLVSSLTLLVELPFSQAVAHPSEVWIGMRSDQSGYVYSSKIRLRINMVSKDVRGAIIWTLQRSPRPHDRHRIGLQGTSYVKGVFDPVTHRLVLASYREDDPFELIGPGRYEFALTNDGTTLSGDIYVDGVWAGSVVALYRDSQIGKTPRLPAP